MREKTVSAILAQARAQVLSAVPAADRQSAFGTLQQLLAAMSALDTTQEADSSA